MLARWRHRVMAIVAALIAGACWLSIVSQLRPNSGVESLTLVAARVGMPTAALLVILTAIPAIILSLVISATGFAASGLMVFAAGLLILAAVGGPIEGWLLAIEQNGGWQGLMLELIFWQALIAIMIYLIHQFQQPLRKRLPQAIIRHDLRSDPSFSIKDSSSYIAGALCGVVAAVIAKFLIRDTDGGQVICSLIVAFAIGAFAARLVFPTASVTTILFSPAIVGLLAYGYMFVNINTQPKIESVWFAGKLPGLAMALPIHFASAGLLGCVLGIGWAGNSHVTAQHDRQKQTATAKG